jgi:hypothetical protein
MVTGVCWLHESTSCLLGGIRLVQKSKPVLIALAWNIIQKIPHLRMYILEVWQKDNVAGSNVWTSLQYIILLCLWVCCYPHLEKPCYLGTYKSNKKELYKVASIINDQQLEGPGVKTQLSSFVAKTNFIIHGKCKQTTEKRGEKKFLRCKWWNMLW